MNKRDKQNIKITDLKDMLIKTEKIYASNPAYKIKEENETYKIITHKEIRQMVNCLGTSLINMGLKGKRIAIIGENRYEWELAYLSIVCGTGIVVPLDKSLPENELENLIKRSKVEAIFYSKKYEKALKQIKDNKDNTLKYLISMDLEKNKKDIYSQKQLIEEGKKLIKNGNKEFENAKIDPEKMSIMLFTSGTTSASKIVALSHKNICSNLMDIASVLDVNSQDTFLSFLPLHHVFECTVGFLLSLYTGAQTVFCIGIRHMVEDIKEHKVSVMASVPAIYEGIFKNIRKQLEKQGKLQEILEKEELCKNLSMEEKKKAFKEIHDMLGGNMKLMISGAASLNSEIEERYRKLGLNLVQGYGLTETSPVVAASIMIGYYEDEEATKNAIKDEWFYTGDLAKIDSEGYIFICGRRKSVIVLKNGKNIFPEEIEGLINQIDGVIESFIFGKQMSEDKNDIKIYSKIVYDKATMKEKYQAEGEKEINSILNDKIKAINNKMPRYKAIRGIIVSQEPLIKTTTNKIKRHENLKLIKEEK